MGIERLSFSDFCRMYDSEHACADALFRARWPDGFRCPLCGHSRSYRISTRRLPLYECASCGHQTSVIAGTVMEGSSTPLTRWFQAIFLLSQPSGISSLRLSKVLGVTYKTAWLISHKLRHAMQEADRARTLTGNVRVEPFHYGSVLYPDGQQPLLIGGSFKEESVPEQVKMKQPHPSHVDNEQRIIGKRGTEAFVRQHTDGKNVSVGGLYSQSPWILLMLKWDVCGWLNTTFNGIGAKHLQAYLDEFCFRVNLKLRTAPVFGELLGWCASTPVLIYKELTRDKPVLPVPWRLWGSRAKWKARHFSAWGA